MKKFVKAWLKNSAIGFLLVLIAALLISPVALFIYAAAVGSVFWGTISGIFFILDVGLLVTLEDL